MRIFFKCSLFMLFLGIATSADALQQDWGGAEDDWSMPTGTAYNGPKASQCVADSSKNQRCRDCREKYNNAGQPTGIIVCAYVPEYGGCGCDFPSTGCRTYGSCSYVH